MVGPSSNSVLLPTPCTFLYRRRSYAFDFLNFFFLAQLSLCRLYLFIFLFGPAWFRMGGWLQYFDRCENFLLLLSTVEQIISQPQAT